MSTATTDLSDAHPEAQICEPVFASFGGRRAFFGPIKTLKVFEDNALVRSTLETPGEGRVLVVDGGGSLRCALFGGNLGLLAVKNGWSGVVVNGLIRDSEEINAQSFGLKALGTHPRKSEKGLHSAHADRVVRFAGVNFYPGHWLYADPDGILVSAVAIHD
ncbi:MAG: ribonuclease E activity regulator RraA [Panacagrimonas sp.]